VLVIDDDVGVRRLLHTVLTAKQLNVVEADSAADAERRIRELRPDAIIIDLTLAETRGLDLLRRLRRRPDLDPVPVVLITGSPSDAGRTRALEAGADDVVAKPFGVADLQQRILRLLRDGRPRLRQVASRMAG
jgi:DNA-binding response OmpR family regulator